MEPNQVTGNNNLLGSINQQPTTAGGGSLSLSDMERAYRNQVAEYERRRQEVERERQRRQQVSPSDYRLYYSNPNAAWVFPNGQMVPEGGQIPQQYVTIDASSMAFGPMMVAEPSSRNDPVLKTSKEVQDKIIQNITDYLNKDFRKYQRRIENVEVQIKAGKAAGFPVGHLIEELMKYKGQLSKLKEKTYSFKQLQAEFDLLKKHDKVEDIYLSNKAHIFIKTKMLFNTHYKTDVVNKEQPIGRFIIRLSYGSGEWLGIVNRDYFYDSWDHGTLWHPLNHDSWDHGTLWHPHIKGGSGDVCLGENQIEAWEMYRNVQLYTLVDFLIVFLAIISQRGSDPYITPSRWLRGKKPRTDKNLPAMFLEEKI